MDHHDQPTHDQPCTETNPSPGWRHGQPCNRTTPHGYTDPHHDRFPGGVDVWQYDEEGALDMGYASTDTPTT
jgi:hypothetical protein